MRQARIIVFLCGLTISAVAIGVEHLDANTQKTAAVLAELSQKSGLPEADLNDLLADCHANQQSMYFCAWRDQIAADKKLRRALTEKKQKIPACKNFLESKIAAWIRFRDQSCDKSTRKEWGEGSMRPTARAICVTKETARMTKRLERIHTCTPS